MKSKVESIVSEFHSDVLIEEYLPGREFSVAVLKKDQANKYLIMPLELVAPADNRGARILSASIKSADLETCKIVSDEKMKERITQLAIGAFRAIGADDYGRIDIRLDGAGKAHFL